MLTTADLFEVTVVIALGFLLAVAFYESLSTRDVLIARVQRRGKRVSGRPWFSALTYALTVIFGIPVLVVIWAVVLDVTLFLVASPQIVDNVAVIAVSVVGATRLLAYVRQSTAHELAKVIPLALGFALLTGGALELDVKVARVSERDGTELTDQMLLYLIGLEIVLRLLTDGVHAALAAYRRRRGIDSDLGFWSTVRHALSRPFAPRPTAQADRGARPDIDAPAGG